MKTTMEEIGKKIAKEDEGKQGIFTVFVENIPEAMVWKGLWHTFTRHGDVVDTYIARKRSKRGVRFGFVRFKSIVDAERAIERMNGFRFYGCRLMVKLAEFEGKTGLRKKVIVKDSIQGERQNIEGRTIKKGNIRSLLRKDDKDEGGVFRENSAKKRIVGHIEEEELMNLRRSLVGTSATVCSVSSIQSRLSEWGLGEIKVQRLGGKIFLLTINDEDLFLMLEDLEWSYLKEIFISVELWMDKIQSNISRATWLEITGVPLSCWNQITFARVAELWGSFEALGENGNHFFDCESVLVLITTTVKKKICEVVEVEVGDLIYTVRVEEKGYISKRSE
ncbi:hypothetical protein V6N13_121393 [Hibiscus sabdariffa]